jgi:lipid-A-disaccharide synthase
MRRKSTTPWVGLPNILASEWLVPELLQEQATPEALADAVYAQLHDASQRARLEERFTAMHIALKRDTVRLAADAILQVAQR